MSPVAPRRAFTASTIDVLRAIMAAADADEPPRLADPATWENVSRAVDNNTCPLSRSARGDDNWSRPSNRCDFTADIFHVEDS